MKIEILPDDEPIPSSIAVPIVIEWGRNHNDQHVLLTFRDRGIWAISEAAISQEIGHSVDIGMLSLLFSIKPRLFTFCGRAG